MPYEEKTINGTLNYRGSPKKDWQPMSAGLLTLKLIGSRCENQFLREANGILRNEIKEIEEDQ